MRLSVASRGARRAGRNRPIDQRVKRKLVVGDIEPDRIAGLQRGTLRQKERQAGEAGFADAIDVGIAGDDIGKLGLQRRLRHVADPDIFGVGMACGKRQSRK